jgi:hypothetical protein
VRGDAAMADADAMRQLHASCPPEEERGEAWAPTEDAEAPEDEEVAISETTMPRADGPRLEEEAQGKRMDVERAPAPDMLSPVSLEDKQEEKEREAPVMRTSYTGSAPSMGYEFSNVRVGAGLFCGGVGADVCARM